MYFRRVFCPIDESGDLYRKARLMGRLRARNLGSKPGGRCWDYRNKPNLRACRKSMDIEKEVFWDYLAMVTNVEDNSRHKNW